MRRVKKHLKDYKVQLIKKSKEAFERLQSPAYKKELEKVINLSQDDAFNIAALRKAYFLNGKDAKKLIEIFKKNR